MSDLEELNELKRNRQELLLNIDYNGSYPNLCSGTLTVKVKGCTWKIDGLCSGGSVWFDNNWSEHVDDGPWTINFPDDFPESYRDKVTDMVNEQVSWGCCGGCV